MSDITLYNEFIHEIENKDLLFISYDKEIPEINRFATFNINIDENGQLKYEKVEKQIPDPSTIYIYLPISNKYEAAPSPYYPHYIELNPEQRYKYLCWLRNVDEPTDMGYVFLYYYGLERHLLVGNFDKAFDQIIRLRNAHKNRSFQTYSENALINSAILRNKVDKLIGLDELTEITGFSNTQLLLAYKFKLSLSADNLISIFYKIYPKCRKAVKEDKRLFIECIEDVLDGDLFNIHKYNIDRVKTRTETRFGNYSFPKDIQTVQVPDFYTCPPFLKDIDVFFNSSYELLKEVRKEQRKNTKASSTKEDVQRAKESKNKERYSKLLKQ